MEITDLANTSLCKPVQGAVIGAVLAPPFFDSADGGQHKTARAALRATAIFYAQFLNGEDTIAAAREIEAYMALSDAHAEAMRIASRSGHDALPDLIRESEAIRAYLAEPQ